MNNSIAYVERNVSTRKIWEGVAASTPLTTGEEVRVADRVDNDGIRDAFRCLLHQVMGVGSVDRVQGDGGHGRVGFNRVENDGTGLH